MVVRLPVSSKAPPSENARADLVGDRRSASSKFRVLVVDDNVDSAESIAKLLQLHGHDARCAFCTSVIIATAIAKKRATLASAAEVTKETVIQDLGVL